MEGVKILCSVARSSRAVSEFSGYDEEKVAMLQSVVSTFPSRQDGSAQQQQQQSSMPQPPLPLSSPSVATTCDICRICHCEAENDAPLIAPCACAGSLRYVHQACLQQWIKSSNTRKCELCKFEFVMQTKIKPLRQWERLQMTPIERRKIFCSVLFHFVAITCVVWSLYVLIDRSADEVRAGVLEWPFWTKLIVVAIGFSGGLVFMYVQCKIYWQLCRRWKAFNRIIYVQNAPPKGATVNTRSNASVSITSAATESTSTSATASAVAVSLKASEPPIVSCGVTVISETTDPVVTDTDHVATLTDDDEQSKSSEASATASSGSEVTIVEQIVNQRVT